MENHELIFPVRNHDFCFLFRRMEHVQKYNEAVTKLKLLLDQSSIHQIDQTNPPSNLSRQGSIRTKEQKRWSSQEDIFHGNHTKGELRYCFCKTFSYKVEIGR